MFVLYGTLKPKAEHQIEVENILAGLIEPSRSEEGSVVYNVHRQADGSLFLYEIWQSEDAHKAHSDTPHMQQFMNDFWPRRLDLLEQEVDAHTATLLETSSDI